MSHRIDSWHDALVEHLQEREWSAEQIQKLSHQIGHSALLSNQGVLSVLEYQQSVDEQIQAEKEYDRWQIARGMIAESFFEDTVPEYNLADHEGEALDPQQLRRWDVC